MSLRKRLTAVLLGLTLTMSVGAPALAANPASGTTSTGQTLNVEITSPADGSAVNVPPGTVTVNGTADIGPLSDSGNVMYVVDVSGSTSFPTNQDCNGDGVVNAGDDINGDGTNGTTLDCEVAGVIALNTSLAGSPGAEAGLILFGSNSAIADVDPAAGEQSFTSPLLADNNGSGGADLHQVARSLRSTGTASLFTAKSVGGGTNFNAALSSIATAFASRAGENNIAFFLSDGQSGLSTGAGSPLSQVVAAGVKVNTYSVGGSSTGCGATANLRIIADATGGVCTEVTDPSQLSSVLITPATVSKVEVSLNGGPLQLAALAGTNWTINLSGLQGGVWNTVAATVTASDGSTATADIQIYGNRAPMADAGGPYVVNEGSPLVLAGTAVDPDGDAVTVSWTPATYLTGANTATPTFQADDNLVENLTMHVADPYGMTDADTAVVVVQNVAPTATLDVIAATDEGSPFTLALINPYDPSMADTLAGFTYEYDCGAGAGWQAGGSCTAIDNPDQTVKGRITDKDGGFTEYMAVVTVHNVAPAVSAISTTADPTPVNTPINFSATFTDPGILDTHTATWDWGDATSDAGTVVEAGGNGSVTGSHTYTTPGIYTVTLTVTDKDGGVGLSVYQYVVIYDPDGGFVTGGGWINSPAGAYTPDPTLTGRANFGFVSKYQRGATVPTGQTQFQFKAGSLNFHSTAYEWLVVAGARAQYKGTGTINGAGSYGFMLTAIDGQVSGGGGVDKFRLKIWDTATNQVIYDNQLGDADDAPVNMAIANGSIVIHR